MATFAKRRGAVDYGVTFAEYIQSSGTQYIDTGFRPNQNTRVVADFDLATDGQVHTIFGTWNDADIGQYICLNYTGMPSALYHGNAYKVGTTSLIGRHTIDANKGTLYVDGNLEVTCDPAAYSCLYPLYLFTLNDKGAPRAMNMTWMKLYSFQIYDNGTLVRDFRPCYDSEGVACMFDKVTKSCFYNAGSGNFSAPSAGGGGGVEVGTTWAYTSDGTFEVPADGRYQVEMHGGGGGGAYNVNFSCGGGGSGEIATLQLTSGEIRNVIVGAGGQSRGAYAYGAFSGLKGGTTYFGSLSQPGGGGAQVYDGGRLQGTASGSIASSGDPYNGVGGEGNTGNTAQTYGDGGSASISMGAINGKPGAVIITYLGA